jgi:hypothetical protein
MRAKGSPAAVGSNGRTTGFFGVNGGYDGFLFPGGRR